MNGYYTMGGQKQYLKFWVCMYSCVFQRLLTSWLKSDVAYLLSFADLYRLLFLEVNEKSFFLFD